MSGCIGLLAVMDALRGKKHRYGLRFVFCGSEERGLLGSKAYVAAHEEELPKVALNINLDMIGTYMGRFIARVSAEDGLVQFIRYFASMRGFGIKASGGVYSSDSTPFADKGVPALSFARLAGGNMAPIHNRYDTPAVLSDEQILKDCDFITACASRVIREIAYSRPDVVIAGNKIPIIAVTDIGKELVLSKLKEIGREPWDRKEPTVDPKPWL